MNSRFIPFWLLNTPILPRFTVNNIYNSRLVGAEGGARWNELGITPINCFDICNVRPGSIYYFRVTPKNRYGWGKSVQTTNTITAGECRSLPLQVDGFTEHRKLDGANKLGCTPNNQKVLQKLFKEEYSIV